MADQDGRHSEMITQLLRHVPSSPPDADVKGNIFRRTVELRFNEVPREWGNLLVISRVSYIENLHITNLWKNNQNARYIEV